MRYGIYAGVCAAALMLGAGGCVPKDETPLDQAGSDMTSSAEEAVEAARDMSALSPASPASPAHETALNDAPEVSAPEIPAYVGVWGDDDAQCANFQEVEDAPMIMTQDGYDQYEAHCTFENVVETAPGVWRVTGDCSVQGDAQEMTMAFSVDADQMKLRDAGEVYATLQRCINVDAGLN